MNENETTRRLEADLNAVRERVAQLEADGMADTEDTAAPGPYPRHGLADTDPALIGTLVQLAQTYGPLGVALVAAELAGVRVTTEPLEDTPGTIIGAWSASGALLDAVETLKETGGAVEIAGVRIEPCDERGQTDTTRRVEKLERLLRMSRRRADRLAREAADR